MQFCCPRCWCARWCIGKWANGQTRDTVCPAGGLRYDLVFVLNSNKKIPARCGQSVDLWTASQRKATKPWLIRIEQAILCALKYGFCILGESMVRLKHTTSQQPAPQPNDGLTNWIIVVAKTVTEKQLIRCHFYELRMKLGWRIFFCLPSDSNQTEWMERMQLPI